MNEPARFLRRKHILFFKQAILEYIVYIGLSKTAIRI